MDGGLLVLCCCYFCCFFICFPFVVSFFYFYLNICVIFISFWVKAVAALDVLQFASDSYNIERLQLNGSARANTRITWVQSTHNLVNCFTTTVTVTATRKSTNMKMRKRKKWQISRSSYYSKIKSYSFHSFHGWRAECKVRAFRLDTNPFVNWATVLSTTNIIIIFNWIKSFSAKVYVNFIDH